MHPMHKFLPVFRLVFQVFGWLFTIWDKIFKFLDGLP